MTLEERAQDRQEQIAHRACEGKGTGFSHNHLPSLIPQTEEAEKHADDADQEKAKEEEKKGLTVEGLLDKFKVGAGKKLDNDRILLSNE